jgi:hypothetical protein
LLDVLEDFLVKTKLAEARLALRSVAAAGVLLLAFATEAGAVVETLQNLINKTGPLAGVITVEDKEFSNFTFGGNSISATKTITLGDLANIQVSDLFTASAAFPGSATVQPGPGLRFADTGSILDVTGSSDVIDFIFSYDITVIGALNRITGSAIQAIQPGDVAVGGGGTVIVSMDTASTPTLFFDGVTTAFADGVFASPLTLLTVGTNVVLFGFGSGTTADLNAFEQRFEQTLVPEPGAWFLLAVGLGTLALVSLRRRSRAG